MEINIIVLALAIGITELLKGLIKQGSTLLGAKLKGTTSNWFFRLLHIAVIATVSVLWVRNFGDGTTEAIKEALKNGLSIGTVSTGLYAIAKEKFKS